MSIYPNGIDSDATIVRIDDNLSELGTEAINQLRDAVFAIETELGIGLRGSKASLSDRITVSLNDNGTIRASALTAVGLVTLPITDNQVASNAGIKEYKLTLDHSTGDLYTLITANAVLLNSVNTFVTSLSADFTNHLHGARFLTDNSTSARHVASHIDLNSIPSDSRDPFYTWAGLKDKFGTARSASQVAGALQQINDDLTGHENSTNGAHQALAVAVDVSEFLEIPQSATDAQKIFDYLDQAEVLNIGEHRATQHANGIPPVARSFGYGLPDGYGTCVVPPTSAITYLIHTPNTSPVDDLSVGDDIIKFVTDNASFVFDAQFGQVRIGDIARVNYGNGIEVSFIIDSIRYTPGSEWIVRINGVNLFDSSTALVRIDRAQADQDTAGILAVAAGNATPTANFSSTLSSVIIGHPRAAVAWGLEFDPGQLDSLHYNLYLEFYPTGNPATHIISLPAIDVTGNAGSTPGSYTLADVVQQTNDNLRKIGYNYRFIAFAHRGQFGVMLADAIQGASFAIIRGINSSGTISTGTFTSNVIGGNSVDDFDALGLGPSKSDVSSPAYQSSYLDSTSAQFPTKVIAPRRRRHYIVNGQKHDSFAPTYLGKSDGYWGPHQADGYWDGYISARTPVAAFSVETTYTVLLDLQPAGLKPGKSLVIQPTIEFANPAYSDVDYGRFIIKAVNFIKNCDNGHTITQITVINGIHGTGAGFGFSSSPVLPVKIYFCADSVSFNNEEIIDTTPATLEYHRLHEIYIDQTGHTFSHERARLPRQTEDSTAGFLATDRWHIIGTGPKLRGYRDGVPLTFNKYVRLYILSYDTASGSFDGYVGQRVAVGLPGILRAGMRVTGRKNVVTRFYDESNVDWVDLKFVDGASPGVSIISGGIARWVDIEIFPSLQLDEELMMLATCEVNWSPAAGQDIVERVLDTRQFGSVSETDLTDSAVDFISSADRWLHENGIVQGLDFDSINSSDNRELFYKGGIALVNGKIITVNDCDVTLPMVYPYGSSLPQIVTWAVCVNQYNSLVPIVVTSTRTQFFATTDGSTSYYVPSVTFDELIQTRKDLCPISLVTAHIASFTITPATDILDVRRFVSNGNEDQTLTLTANTTSGNFHSFRAVRNWVNSFGLSAGTSGPIVVKVRGIFNITSSQDLTGFTSPVIFEGDGATLNVTSAQGIVLGSKVTVRGFQFIYSPPVSLVYTVGNVINSGNGCIYCPPGTNVSDVTIERCSFAQNSSSYTQRPPFINFELNNNQVNSNIRITDNNFSDVSTSITMAAVAIVGTNTGLSSNPCALRDVFIERNTTNNIQGIYVTSPTSARPGMRAHNCCIQGNGCGIIGYFVSSTDTSLTLPHSLFITHNRCKAIASVNSLGQVMYNVGSSVDVATGNVLIQSNMCHWIHVMSQGNTANVEFGELKINDNILNCFSTSFLTSYNDTSAAAILSGLPGVSSNAAISVITRFTGAENSSVMISGNTIENGKFSSALYPYDVGIYVTSSGSITNNIIKGLNTGGTGIWLDKGLGANTAVRQHLVQGNQIFRNNVAITAYINIIPVTVATDRGEIIDNIFDSTTIDGSVSTTILPILSAVTYPLRYIIERNKNQTYSSTVGQYEGTWSVNGVFAGTNALTTNIIVFGSDVIVNYTDTSTDLTVALVVPLEGRIPLGAIVSSINATVSVDVVGGLTSRTFGMQLFGAAGNSSALSPVTVTTTPTLVTLTPAPIIANTPGTNALIASFFFDINGSSSRAFTIQNVTINYHW